MSRVNFLDENGEEAVKYLINSRPTTFLLDPQGTIITGGMEF